MLEPQEEVGTCDIKCLEMILKALFYIPSLEEIYKESAKFPPVTFSRINARPKRSLEPK